MLCAVRKDQNARGIWDLGKVIPPNKNGRTTWEYFIWQHKINEFLGIGEKGEQA